MCFDKMLFYVFEFLNFCLREGIRQSECHKLEFPELIPMRQQTRVFDGQILSPIKIGIIHYIMC